MTEITWTLTSLSQLAMLLEASSPKPGNVNRLQRFSDMSYRHFVASSSLSGRGLFMAAQRGEMLSRGIIDASNVRLGEAIVTCAEDVFGYINRANTVFGSILLQVPLIAAIAAAVCDSGHFSTTSVREWLKRILDASTVEDTLDLYRAFFIVRPIGSKNKGNRNWTSTHDRYDIDNPHVLDNIIQDVVSLKQLFDLSATVDEISSEWSQYFRMTLTEVFPMLDSQVTGLEDFEEGTVNTYLWLLSKRPDGLITKKAGHTAAERVREMAERIVRAKEMGQTPTEEIAALDIALRRNGNRLNPGTTADLISAAILCKLVKMRYG